MAARPQSDEQKRVLYAIWGYNITVQFEDETGYTADGTKDPVLGSPMTEYSFTLKGQAVEEGKEWTLDLTNPEVMTAITAATNDPAQTLFAVGDQRGSYYELCLRNCKKS